MSPNIHFSLEQFSLNIFDIYRSVKRNVSLLGIENKEDPGLRGLGGADGGLGKMYMEWSAGTPLKEAASSWASFLPFASVAREHVLDTGDGR